MKFSKVKSKVDKYWDDNVVKAYEHTIQSKKKSWGSLF